MIAMLEGTLVEKTPGMAVLSAGGVGYAVAIPLSTFDRLPSTGETAKVFTYLHVREDALNLYGFHSREDRSTFEKMIGCQRSRTQAGSGHSLRLAGFRTGCGYRNRPDRTVEQDFRSGKENRRASGAGTQGQAGRGGHGFTGRERRAGAALDEEAVAALMSLGFSRTLAEKAVAKAAAATDEKLSTSDLVRRALASM